MDDVQLADNYLMRRQAADFDDALEYLGAGTAKESKAAPLPHNPPATDDAGPLDTAAKVAKDVGKGIIETPRALYHGAAEAANEALDLAGAVGDWVEDATGLGGLEIRLVPDQTDNFFEDYPALSDYKVKVVRSQGGKDWRGNPTLGRKMEFYPPDAGDNPNPGHPTIEVYDSSMSNKDMMGEIYSHYLPKVDPEFKSGREKFMRTLTDEQVNQWLGGDYERSKPDYERMQAFTNAPKNFREYVQNQGGDAFFRGFSTGQFPAEAYTDEQKKILSDLEQKLKVSTSKNKSNPSGLKIDIRMLSAEQLAAKRAKGEGLADQRLPLPDDPESVTGGIVEGAAQFLTGFSVASKMLRGTKAAAALGQWGTSMAAGAIADATVFDEHTERLSNLVEKFPALRNPVTAYLKADPTDSVAEGRFKNALEGLGLGTITHGLALAAKAIRSNLVARGVDAADALTASKQARAPVEPDLEEVAKRGPPAPGPNLKPLGDPSKPKITETAVDEAEGWLKVQGDAEGKAININLARLETPDDVKEAISKTAKTFAAPIDEARRGKITQEETARLADDLGMTVESLVSRRQGAAFNAEEAFASRRILASSASNLVGLAKRVQGVGATEVDQLAFRRALSVHAAIQQQVSGMTAEAGRALAQFRMMATEGDAQTRAIREMLDLSGSGVEAQKLAGMIATLDTPAGVNTFVRQAQKATTKDMVFEAWINGLLSGPATHVANLTSNSIVAAWQIPERAVAAGIRRLTGGDGVMPGEATAQMYGLVKGARDGFALAWQALKTGEPTDAMGKIEAAKHRAISAANLDLSGIPGYMADFLGSVVRLPGRFLMAGDELFKSIGYRMELNALAYRTAAQENLSGADFARRAADIMANPPSTISIAAQDAARYQTFTKPLGPAGNMAMGAISRIPGARVIFPFIRTPTNIMKFVGEHTPLAPFSAAVRADIAAGGARRDLALAKISTGAMVMAVGADMAMSGQISGGGPTDPGLRAAKRRTGWQPYSVHVGDTWYSYNRLDPLGATLGLAADMSEIAGHLDDPDASELGAALVMAVSNNIVNKSYLEGFSTLVGAFNQMSPEAGASRGERVLAQFAGSLIPTGAAALERTLDPTLRDARGVMDSMRARIPGFSDDLPPTRNLWGEPVELSGGLGPDIMSPIYSSQDTHSAIDDEIVRLGLSIDMPTKALNGIELAPEEYSRFVELAGNAAKYDGLGLKDRLEQVIRSPEYRAASDGADGMKALIIRKHVQAYRQVAKEQLQQEFPELKGLLLLQEYDKAEALQ